MVISFILSLFPSVSLFSISRDRYLCDKYATTIEFRLDGVFVEGFGVKFVTRASLYRVCQVSYYHIIALLSDF